MIDGLRAVERQVVGVEPAISSSSNRLAAATGNAARVHRFIGIIIP
jgi:hypothetical protein